MRTIDPELWHKQLKKPYVAGEFRRFAQPPDSGLEYCIRESFKDTVKDFLQTCSIVGIKYLKRDDKLCKYKRLLLSMFIVMALCVGVFSLTRKVNSEITLSPLILNLLTSQHPIERVPFPAVALCSNNLISRASLEPILQKLTSRDKNSTYTEDEWRHNLLHLGRQITLEYEPEVDLKFGRIMARYLNNFNITDVMFKLSPKCKDTLKRCRWRGVIMPCNNLFATRVTSIGFCCVFNGRYQLEDLKSQPKLLEFTGPKKGLSVIVHEDVHDYLYFRRPNVGFDVLLFDGSEYPLIEGGEVKTYLATRHTSVQFPISVSEQKLGEGLNVFSDERRGCRKKTPPDVFPKVSFSHCLLICRRQTIHMLCNCVPYTMVPQANETVCGTYHLRCLNKHREKFISYEPRLIDEEIQTTLLKEIKDGLSCPECLPDCARVRYTTSAGYLRYSQKGNKLYKSPLFTNINLVNTSYLRFFYSTDDQRLFAVESNVRWYEALATFGSQWTLMLGTTLITAFEIIYHCSIRWMHHFWRQKTCVNV